jgi:riboflavin kinase / FMN adenylyltransferase
VLRWTNLSQVPAGFGPSVVTLGNFDGVHRGHRAVLGVVVEQARATGAQAVAVTFEPHPVAVLHPERAPQIITGPDHRLALLEATGLDAVLVMEFTRELAAWTPEQFVRAVFVEALGARVVVVGEDTRFGVRNSGDVTTLRTLGREHGFEVLTLEDLGGEVRWSSSRVRELVAAGDVSGAAEILGRPHRVSGTVVHGDHRGRELGYPTANLGPVVSGLVPADGVYAGWLLRPGLSPDHPDSTMPAAVSIGTNPTFDGVERRVEGYVLDRTDLDLYGERICYELVRRLRPTLKYEGIEPLVRQMNLDVAQCRDILSTIVPS